MFAIDSMVFHIGVSFYAILTDIARIEISANEFVVPAYKWIRLDGTRIQPEDTRLDSYFIYVGVRFGSSFFPAPVQISKAGN